MTSQDNSEFKPTSASNAALDPAQETAPSAQQIQIDLARTRTLLAMDRTLLAWVRTSLSLLAFGFTLARFVHDMVMAKTLPGIDASYPRHLGIALMVLGIGGLLAGAYDHWQSVKSIRGDVRVSMWSAALVVALFIALASLVLMADILQGMSTH